MTKKCSDPRYYLLITLLTLAACGLAAAQVPPPTTTPPPTTSPDTELLTPKSSLAGYGAESHRLVSQPDEIISVLRNGMTVITRRIASPVVAVRGYAMAGSVYEGRWLGGGLSHLLEHLCAGGSNGRRTEEQNRNLLQGIGNNSNAYTQTDHTAFFIDTTTDHIDEAVDLVTGWMLTAQITEPEYRREYQVVQRELEMDKGRPDFVFAQLTDMNRYRINATGVPIIGYQEVIQGLKVDDVRGYYHLAYQPNNIVFTVVGNLDPEVMLKVVEKNVADAKPGRVFPHDSQAEPAVVSPRTMVATFPKLGQARLELSFPSVQLDSPDLYALDLLAAILGENDSSICTEVIRDQKQLVSSISVEDYTPSYVAGSFSVDLQCDPDKVPAATKAVMEELEKVKSAPIDPQRIDRAKTQMRMDHLQTLQTADGVAGDLALDFYQTGDAHFGDRYVERVSGISQQQLQDVARKYLDPQHLLTTALIPSEAAGASELPKAVDLLRPAAAATASVASSQPSDQSITRTVLPNGVVLLHKFLSTTPLVSIRMASPGGVTSEDANNNGIGNLAMQTLMRGTSTRSAEQIAETLESMGATLNTGCGNNSWYWNATCLKTDLDKTMTLIADVVNHPAFADAEVAAMKQRTAADIASEDSDWTAQAMRFFKKSYYGPRNSSHQFLPVGTNETVAKLTAADLKNWYTGKILAGPRVLAIFGDIPLEDAKAIAMKYLGDGPVVPAPPRVQVGPIPASQPSTAIASMDVQRVEVLKTEQPLAGVVIGFNSNSTISSPQVPVLAMADCLTSGYSGGTGYLFDVLRGKGLVYVVQTQDVPGIKASDPGTFLAYAGCDPQRVNEVVDLILENVARLQGSADDIQTDWFDRSKQLITTADALDNETPDAQAMTALLDEAFGLGFDWHAGFADRIRAVRLDQMQSEARAGLSSCVVTISTPAPELVKQQAGKREYKSFPRVDLTPRGVQHDTGVGGTK